MTPTQLLQAFVDPRNWYATGDFHSGETKWVWGPKSAALAKVKRPWELLAKLDEGSVVVAVSPQPEPAPDKASEKSRPVSPLNPSAPASTTAAHTTPVHYPLEDETVEVCGCHAFGAPHITGRSIKTNVIADLWHAERTPDSSDDEASSLVAWWLDVTPDQVMAAVRFENLPRRQLRKWRRIGQALAAALWCR